MSHCRNNSKIVEKGKMDTPNTHVYMTAHIKLGGGGTLVMYIYKD